MVDTPEQYPSSVVCGNFYATHTEVTLHGHAIRNNEPVLLDIDVCSCTAPSWAVRVAEALDIATRLSDIDLGIDMDMLEEMLSGYEVDVCNGCVKLFVGRDLRRCSDGNFRCASCCDKFEEEGGTVHERLCNL